MVKFSSLVFRVFLYAHLTMNNKKQKLLLLAAALAWQYSLSFFFVLPV